MAKAPYDKRNEEDYRQLTLKIRAGLAMLRKDPSIPATEQSLAKLSECSRGTLGKRGWPLEELKAIKRERKTPVIGDGPNPPPAQPTAEEIHLEDKKRLLESLNNSRAENGRLFFELQEEKAKNKRLERVRKVLENAKVGLEKRVSELEREEANLKGTGSPGTGVVVTFRGSTKSIPTKSRSRKGKALVD